jgi:multicomponent Na+:H+ antiporter subunit B
MSLRVRRAVFAVGALGLAALLAWGFAGLPALGDFDGRYGELIARIAVPQRTASEVVGTTTLDYRAFDTLGEELILFTAAVGVAVLLRLQRGDRPQPAAADAREPTGRSHALRAIGVALFGPVILLGLYVIAHGHLTPGGGFQGGVILMSAFLLVFLSGARLRHIGRAPQVEGIELAEGLGVAGFGLIGLGGLLIGSAFLENFLPLGSFGELVSGGTLPLSNIAIAIEVMGATLAILGELLDERLLSQPGK